MRSDWQQSLEDVLDPLPTAHGGVAVVLATAGRPPALAVLSSGDILISRDSVRVGVLGTSSTVSRLGGSFSLLVPARTVALRVEAVDATATKSGRLAMIEGRLDDVRETSEPPWLLSMTFGPSDVHAPAIPGHLRYWRSVRAWLRGDQEAAPEPPAEVL